MFFHITCNNTLNQCHACKDTWLSDFLLTHPGNINEATIRRFLELGGDLAVVS